MITKEIIKECDKCNGTGSIWVGYGSGHGYDEKCDKCNSTGKIKVKKGYFTIEEINQVLTHLADKSHSW